MTLPTIFFSHTLSLTHTHSLSLSLSLSHTHPHTLTSPFSAVDTISVYIIFNLSLSLPTVIYFSLSYFLIFSAEHSLYYRLSLSLSLSLSLTHTHSFCYLFLFLSLLHPRYLLYKHSFYITLSLSPTVSHRSFISLNLPPSFPLSIFRPNRSASFRRLTAAVKFFFSDDFSLASLAVPATTTLTTTS